MPDKTAFYMKTVRRLRELFETGEKGCSEEADKRLSEYGENTLTTTLDAKVVKVSLSLKM